MTAFYPMGICDFNSDCIAYGFTNKADTYLCVVRKSGEGTISIPLDDKFVSAEVIYPANLDLEYSIMSGELNVTMPEKME